MTVERRDSGRVVDRCSQEGVLDEFEQGGLHAVPIASIGEHHGNVGPNRQGLTYVFESMDGLAVEAVDAHQVESSTTDLAESGSQDDGFRCPERG